MTAASGPVRPGPGPGRILDMTPVGAGWDHLAFSVVEVDADHPFAETADGRETAIVPLSGAGTVTVGDETVELSRRSVFDEKPRPGDPRGGGPSVRPAPPADHAGLRGPSRLHGGNRHAVARDAGSDERG